MRLFELLERSQYQRRDAARVTDDRFFTRPEIASQWASWVKSQPFYSKVTRVIDPAAGAQALSRHFSNAEEYDLNPMSDEIVKQDFLTSSHGYAPGTMFIMNPPFGKRSDLAVAFFNRAAQSADYIAGIFPISFRRESLQRGLDDRFHLVDEYVLPHGAFYLPDEDDGHLRKYHVPAVAQVWSRSEHRRDTAAPTVGKPEGWAFTTPDKADFAIRRKGRPLGKIVTDAVAGQNPNSFYFIAGDDAVLHAFTSVDWKQYGQNNIGAPSVSKAEIIKAVGKIL